MRDMTEEKDTAGVCTPAGGTSWGTSLAGEQYGGRTELRGNSWGNRPECGKRNRISRVTGISFSTSSRRAGSCEKLGIPNFQAHFPGRDSPDPAGARKMRTSWISCARRTSLFSVETSRFCSTIPCDGETHLRGARDLPATRRSARHEAVRTWRIRELE